MGTRAEPLQSFGGLPLEELRADTLPEPKKYELDLSAKGISAPEVLLLAEALSEPAVGASLGVLKLHGSLNRTLRKALEAAVAKRVERGEHEVRLMYTEDSRRFQRRASARW